MDRYFYSILSNDKISQAAISDFIEPGSYFRLLYPGRYKDSGKLWPQLSAYLRTQEYVLPETYLNIAFQIACIIPDRKDEIVFSQNQKDGFLLRMQKKYEILDGLNFIDIASCLKIFLPEEFDEFVKSKGTPSGRR